ncbi:hypothetical protein HK405_010293 [Cladochytrium tenue]|nr:hypothetical protein HK405_010293 [Cladochytrium tenue]
MFGSSFQAYKDANDKVSLAGKSAVVVGGTGTIGKAIVSRLASMGAATVVVVGRNEAAVRDLVAAAPSGVVRFLKCDAALMADVRVAAATIREMLPGGLDFLVLLSGVYADKNILTSEGRDWFLAVTFWARMVFAKELLPSLAKRAGCVLCVHRGSMDSSFTSPVDLDDLDMTKGKYSFWSVTAKSGQLIDGVFKELAVRNPAAKVRFIHTTPGIILGPGFADWPAFVRYPIYLLSPLIARTAAQNADVMVGMMLNTGPATAEVKTTSSSAFEVRDRYGRPGTMAGWIASDPAVAPRVYDAVAKVAF